MAVIVSRRGSIFWSNCNVLVNPVNLVGVMGAGLALEFKRKYPDMFVAYSFCCKEKAFHMGEVKIYSINPFRHICLFPTKVHWKDDSKISYIEMGLKAVAEYVKQDKIKSIAFPKIGCGLGGLNWAEVRPLIIKTFKDINVEIELYE